MATITTINATDKVGDSRTVINTNFGNLNSDKIETSYLDADGTLAANSDTKIATQKAVKTYVDGMADAFNLFQYKGAIDASTNPDYPAASIGRSYRISVAGKIWGASGRNVEVWEYIICHVDSSPSGDEAAVWANWNIFQVSFDPTDYLLKSWGTMTGSITLAENAGIANDPSLSADGKWTGITITGTAWATLAFGDLIYLDPTDSRRELADANSAAWADGDARGILGICVQAAASDGSATTILLNGVVRADAAFPTFTVNNPIYVSETAWDVTGTRPSTADVVIRVVGFGLTADSMYFNPSSDYITHTG